MLNQRRASFVAGQVTGECIILGLVFLDMNFEDEQNQQ